MSDGSEFQVCGAATENARRANSVRVLAADSRSTQYFTDTEVVCPFEDGHPSQC